MGTPPPGMQSSPDERSSDSAARHHRPTRFRTPELLLVWSALLFVVSVALYVEPSSFYSNFTVLPSLATFITACVIDAVGLVLSCVAFYRFRRLKDLVLIACAVVIPLLTFLVVLLGLRR